MENVSLFSALLIDFLLPDTKCLGEGQGKRVYVYTYINMGDDKLEFSYPTAVSAVQCSVCGLQCVLLTLTSDGVVLQGLTLSHI